MRLYRFQDREHYVRVQTETNRRKIASIWIQEHELEALVAYIRKHLPRSSFGICHGVRNGWEVYELRERLGIEVIGTEISSTASLFPHVIQWDFHEIKSEWINSVDFIYTNALDHSYDPHLCLNRWTQCLTAEGRCILHWSSAHDLEGSKLHDGVADCCQAPLSEYREMISRRFVGCDVIRLPVHEGQQRFFVVGVCRKPEWITRIADGS